MATFDRRDVVGRGGIDPRSTGAAIGICAVVVIEVRYTVFCMSRDDSFGLDAEKGPLGGNRQTLELDVATFK